MKGLKNSILKIDWQNHFVAFISTLLGIFIAFQLDDWNEEIKQKREIKLTLDAIKKEIEANMEIFNANAALSEFVDYIEFVRNRTNAKGEFVVSKSELKPYKKKFPEKFDRLKLLRVTSDTLLVYQSNFTIDIIPKLGISTNNWEAAKASGVLNLIDHSQVAVLTAIYDWTDKDLGFNESEFYKRNLIKENEITDLIEMTKDYSKVARVSEYKLRMIKNAYESIVW